MTSAYMKKVLLALFLCAACTVVGWAQEVDPRLFGTWVQEGSPANVWTFRPDGSGFMEQPNPRCTARFTWSCQGQQLSVSTGPGMSVPYTVISSDSNSLVIRNEQVAAVYKLKKS